MDPSPHSTFPPPFVRHPSAMNAPSVQVSDPFAIDDCSRHMGMDQSNGPQYAPASGPGPGPGPGSSGFGRILNFVSPKTYQHPIDQYLYSQDGPWVPDGSRVRGQPPPASLTGPSFSGYRNTHLPSDCGTALGPGIAPSDSGYESMTRQSVANPSTVGDLDGTSETINLQLSNIQLHGPNRGPSGYPGELLNLGVVPTNLAAGTIFCTYCNIELKTRSELNKHEARHTKPHSCTEPGCSRKEGFGTLNDLDRHRKSVHGTDGIKFNCPHGQCLKKRKLWPRADNFRQHLKRVHDLGHNGEVDLESYMVQYVGQANRDPTNVDPVPTSVGLAAEQSPTSDHTDMPFKTWGGAEANDGISQTDGADGGTAFDSDFGLRRPNDANSTSELDFNRLIGTNGGLPQDTDELSKPMARYTPQASESLPGTGNSDDLGPDAATTSVGGSYGSDLPCIQPGELDARAIVPVTMPGAHGSEPSEMAIPDEQDAMSIDSDIEPTDDGPLLDDVAEPSADSRGLGNGEDAWSPGTPGLVIDATRKIDLTDEAAASDFIKDLEDKGLLEKLMEQHGYQKAKGILGEPKKPAASLPSPHGNKVRCEECGKTFSRKCELTKHMKRHEKPYGCTFPDCRKAFGSKNDWKRHENSQHFQLQIWSCDVKVKVKDGGGGSCGKYFDRRETFRHHLAKDHGVVAVEEKLNSCRVGENRCWCGFCKRIVEINQKGLSAWTGRYDHIDDHLHGRNGPKMHMFSWMHMSAWISAEQDPLEAGPCVSGPDDGSGESGPETTGDDAGVIDRADDGSGESGPETTGDDAGVIDRADDEAAASHTHLQPRKRPGEDDGPRPSSKRSRHDGDAHSVWVCCECRDYQIEGVTDYCLSCPNNHRRCLHCTVGYRDDGLDDMLTTQ